ncbi:MAG: GntR family transcriptional regulator [Enterocloster clostridioformis]
MDTGIARSEQVYEHLKNLILSRALKPGEKIPEAKLAAQFGLSRTPIREAIKKLANDGIVTLYPNRFAEVSVLPQNWLQEVGMVRLSLDIVAAHLAILYGSNYDYSIMQKA